MTTRSTVTVAAAQYAVEFLGSWDRYAAKMTAMTETATGQGAQLLVFPEYASMELASIFPPEIYGDMDNQFAALQTIAEPFLALHCQLAQQHDCYIVAASFRLTLADGRLVNRAYFCRPDGSYDFQDKLIMTRFEHEEWHVVPGDEIKIFETQFGLVGINICYDSEFPMVARSQVEAGADLILVPSCTDTHAGYQRVRTGCRARALENQCYVIMAPVVGMAAWSDAIDINVGAAGVFTPIDYGFPSDGVMATGEMNQDMWLVVELNLAEIARVRAEGQVFNYRDWHRQFNLGTAGLDAVVTVPESGWLVPALVTSVAHAHPAPARND